MNIIEDGVRPTFGGHEKFVFRNGWLKKGVDAVINDQHVFTNDNSLVTLGVGKNMVRSIRHWCLATGMLSETGKTPQTRLLQVTPLAQSLIVKGGWDPFFEDIGTLWLLHWQLVSNQTRSLVWYATFSAFLEAEFSKKQLAAFLAKQFEHSGIRTTLGMIEREVDCCLRTYVPARTKLGTISEEGLDCPLAELDLIRYTQEDNVYRFNIGPKLSLPVEIFGYALLTFLSKIAVERRSIGIDECIYHYGSPGQAFKLDENTVVDYLEKLEIVTNNYLQLRDTAGLRQIYIHETLGDSLKNFASELLGTYYGQN